MLNVVVLAAGKGTRMNSALPKVLHTIGGHSMLARVIAAARQLNPARIIVVVGHDAQRVQSRFADQPDLHFVLQEPQEGTGHAVQQAIPELLDDGSEQAKTLVLYGDVPLVQPDTMRGLLQASQQGMAILTELLSDPSGYGRIVRDAQGQIEAIVEHKDASEEQLKINEVNTGILVAPTTALTDWLKRLSNDNAQREYYLTDIVGFSRADGVPIYAAHPEQPWETQGVNSRVQQAECERAWQRAQAQALLESGVSMADPERFDLRGELHCGQDVFIDVGCVFEGEVHLGDGVHVGPHTYIRNATLQAGAVVHPFTHIDGAQLQDQSQVGPFARLRPGTQLGPDVRIGNFVEIKNSRMGQGAQASHLSYLGDAQIGQRVNVGAGTITCNYDGANKHLTVIEDDAFIGSDSQLVAPVTVGAGATIGAGTTLTRDAPANALTLSRAEQKTYTQWKRPTKKSNG
ncbi:MAG TPA: bifunctional UDP-N-acetylglucosamine diphosphorylase/glucosamine-1-phosphate N-acetyltransferase GlmU [Paenalcaligenes sp.]|nr:bifunctional UDP-N-acetylglucosamine diphosphorylase/glucosamine-1-phosphate N-acetyltransferase GlmU [Paenalcaligenes sp.]